MRIENESGQPSHMSYKEYKKKINKNKTQTFMMFVSVFFVLLLIFLGFAKLMSPDVDIAIGDDTVTTELDASNTEYSRTGNVDDRLKALQAEDEEVVVNEEAKTEDAGLVKIPEINKKMSELSEQTEKAITLEEEPVKKTPAENNKPEEVQHQAAPAPDSTMAPTAPSQPAPAAPAITARVVVGFYNTQAQASVAKGILQEAGLGVTPHIRPMGSGYTLQVGAYSSKEAANNLANKLLMNNYPARVIIEGN